MKFDLSKPVFVTYIGVKGLSPAKAKSVVNKAMLQLSSPDVNMIIIPADRTSVECIYKP